MNKFLLVVGILSIAVLTLGVAGFAYAQGQTPPAPEYPYGPGMMGDYAGHGYDHSMMDGNGHGYGMGYGIMGSNGEYGPMHEAMVTTITEALDLTSDEIEVRHNSGETLWEIAEAEGLSAEEIQDLMFSAHNYASEDAVANGWLTEEQVESMDAHMEQMWSGDSQSGGFGGHCGGGGWYNNNSR